MRSAGLARVEGDVKSLARELKAAGAWERYSHLDYPALKKALADPANADRAVLDRIEPFLQDDSAAEFDLQPIEKD